MIPFLKLIRYKNLLMVLLTMVLTKYALINYILIESYLSNLDFIILAFSVLFITAGGYIINDIYDVEVDKINKPSKVIIGNTVSSKNAWTSYILLTVLGLCLGIFISYHKYLYNHLFYFIGTALSLFLYSKYLKKIALIGNLVIAFLCAFVIYLIFTFDLRIDIDEYLKKINFRGINQIQFFNLFKFYFLFMSFMITLIRELIKDIEDIKGDYNSNYKTLPIILGKKRVRNLIIVLASILSILIMIYSSLFYDLDFKMISILTFIIGACLLIFIYKLWSAKTKKQFHFLSNLMKLIMLLGILSMGLFKFI
tara:strand:- start:5161 stop:6090 length:930 start_codon:yes stop_codon:yes gene_type:complete